MVVAAVPVAVAVVSKPPRICHVGGEGMFMSAFSEAPTIPDIPSGLAIGLLMVYCFMGVAIISDIFMGSIETVTSRKRKVVDKKTGKTSTENLWNDTVATLTLMALGSSAPEIFLAVIETFKKEFHAGDLGPSTIVGSAAFNLFMIISVCVSVIPHKEVRKIANINAFLVTAVFSVGAYMWMVLVLVIHGKDVVDIYEAVLTFLYLPLLVWTAYSADVGMLARAANYFWPEQEEDSSPHEKQKHEIGFEASSLVVPGSMESQTMEVSIIRKGRARAAVRCNYATQRMTGVPGYDFTDVAGTIEFETNEVSVMLQLEILPKSKDAVSREFLLVLEDSEGSGDFDPEGDGGEESQVLTITIDAIDNTRSISRSVDGFINRNSIRFAFDEWADQFASAFFVNGSLEEQADASWQDWVYHILSCPWRLLFGFVPPASFFGGWLAFFVAILMIGLCTAFVSDVAEMFGCLLDIPDIVTATIFVALGTSMPDLFASLSAAVGDPTADAAVVNVTGSNAVNVFLGLGIPWMASSFYWTFGERTLDWEQRYPEIASNPKYDGGAVFVVESRNLGFCVLIFSGLCCIAIVLLVMRRVFLGAELGGPSVPKYASSFLLGFLWLAFVSLTSWRVLRCEGASPGHWCKASVLEQMIVCGSVMFATFLVSLPTLISTYMYSTEAREEAKSQLKHRRWSQIFNLPSDDLGLISPEAESDDKENGKTVSGLENEVYVSEDGFAKVQTAPEEPGPPRPDDILRKHGKAEQSPSEAPSFDDIFDHKESRKGSEVLCMKLEGISCPRDGSPVCESNTVSMLPSGHGRNNIPVDVVVVAYHTKGRNETIFQSSMSVPLKQVMSAWCKHHSLDAKRASFFHKGLSRPISASDTPASLGHDPKKGPLTICGRPNRAGGEPGPDYADFSKGTKEQVTTTLLS